MPLTTGSRAQVMHGNAKKTTGGLTKANLKYNKRGNIVSKRVSTIAKKNNHLVKAGYVTEKGVFRTSMKGGMIYKIDDLYSEYTISKETQRILNTKLATLYKSRFFHNNSSIYSQVCRYIHDYLEQSDDTESSDTILKSMIDNKIIDNVIAGILFINKMRNILQEKVPVLDINDYEFANNVINEPGAFGTVYIATRVGQCYAI